MVHRATKRTNCVKCLSTSIHTCIGAKDYAKSPRFYRNLSFAAVVIGPKMSLCIAEEELHAGHPPLSLDEYGLRFADQKDQPDCSGQPFPEKMTRLDQLAFDGMGGDVEKIGDCRVSDALIIVQHEDAPAYGGQEVNGFLNELRLLARNQLLPPVVASDQGVLLGVGGGQALIGGNFFQVVEGGIPGDLMQKGRQRTPGVDVGSPLPKLDKNIGGSFFRQVLPTDQAQAEGVDLALVFGEKLTETFVITSDETRYNLMFLLGLHNLSAI